MSLANAAALAGPTAADEAEPTIYTLEADEELRIEVGSTPVEVSLLFGTCEVFGTEIVKDMAYKVRDTAIAFYTFHGCQLSVVGQPLSAYVSSECPVRIYANVHAELDKMRRNAARAMPTVTLPASPLADDAAVKPDTTKVEGSDESLESVAVAAASAASAASSSTSAAGSAPPRMVTIPSPDSAGPRVLVVGGPSVGKSTLCRTLASYAVRSGWKPTFVDLDTADNALVPPGAIAATSIEQPIGCDGVLTSYDLNSPVSFFLGHPQASDNAHLWRRIVTRLARSVDARIGEGYTVAVDELRARQRARGASASAAAGADALAALAAVPTDAVPQQSVPPLSEERRRVRASGLIINMPTVVGAIDVSYVAHVASAFRVDVVLVLDNERLAAALKQDPVFTDIALAQLPKSGGVVALDDSGRDARQLRRIQQYFYGPNGDYAPYAITFPVSQVSVFSTAAAPVLSQNALPFGMTESALGRDRLLAVTLGREHSNRIVAVTAAESAAEAGWEPALGFLHLKAVDGRVVRCLAPSVGALPGHGRLLLGSVSWFE